MKTRKQTTDSERLDIVCKLTGCSKQTAVQVIVHLDKYSSLRATPTREPSEFSSYTRAHELLPVGRSALFTAGYDQSESEKILASLFFGLSGKYGGNIIYLPKWGKLKNIFDI